MVATPTPGVSVTPSCPAKGCASDGSAAANGGALFLALIAAVLIIFWASGKRK
jgi:hypothetical protein